MRIPDTINENTLLAYGPSVEAKNAEIGRALRAEDPDWLKGKVDTLAHLCINTLPAILAFCLPSPAKEYMLEILPTDLPLPLATKVIKDGEYWRRRTNAQWKTPGNVQDTDGSWKRFYLEKYAQELVESLPPQGYVFEELTSLCNLVSDYIYRLNLRQLQVQRRFLEEEDDGIEEEPRDRIDLKPLIIGLKNLTELHIQFGVRGVGTNYRKVLLQFTTQDCRNIGQGVAESSVLRLLRIHHSALDDNKLITLLSQMQSNTSLEALYFPHCQLTDEGAAAIAKFLSGHNQLKKLDIRNIGQGVAESSVLRLLRIHHSALDDNKLITLLSQMQSNTSLEALYFPHCQLTDEGAAAIAKFLSGHNQLKKLDISNNKIGEVGVKALAFVLTQQDGGGLTEMNLRLNAFGDSGAKYLLSALTRKAPAIRMLNLSCSGLGEDSGLLIGEVFSRNESLIDVDISNNNLGIYSGDAILKGMEGNKVLQFLDLRMTGVTKEVQLSLEKMLHVNRCRDKSRRDTEDDDTFLP